MRSPDSLAQSLDLNCINELDVVIEIHWDSNYQYCEFPRESNALCQAPSSATSTSNCVCCGQSLQQYLEEDRIHCEYIEATKHFEYQKWCKAILSERVCCSWQCSCEHCKLNKHH